MLFDFVHSREIYCQDETELEKFQLEKWVFGTSS